MGKTECPHKRRLGLTCVNGAASAVQAPSPRAARQPRNGYYGPTACNSHNNSNVFQAILFISNAKNMALAARFRQLDGSLNDFLFATIGDEESGMQLSVASALARLGIDPWTEAIRLAELPRAKAIEALAGMVAAIPFARWKPADAPGIATRLSLLLPGPDSGRSVSGAKLPSLGRARPVRFPLLLLLSLVAAVLFGMLAFRQPPANTGGTPSALHSVVSP